MKTTIQFSDLTPDERQAWADFTLHEIERHEQDINRGREELEIIRNKYGIYPRRVFVGTWLEVS